MPSQTQDPLLTPACYWVIVPAAGLGTRMGSSIPKQYLILGSKSILEHTLDRLLKIPSVVGVVVAVSEADNHWPNLAISQHPLIHTVVGGLERANSVSNVLNFLQNKVRAHDWILVHDAARPCVSLANIQMLCASLVDDPVGGILALPVGDTIKQVDDHQGIVSTVDRRKLWQAQTPQLFRYALLVDCLAHALLQKANITDESSAIELCGYSPKVIEGRSDNIKITRPDDLLLATFILRQQEKNSPFQE